MNKVCVLIRVYNRVEDLACCVNIIRDTWKLNNYYIIVVSNGEKDGHIISQECKDKIDKFISLTDNIGHFNGNSQLLLAAISSIPDDCAYTIILEADTWLYGDELTQHYIERLENEQAVWASAQFFRYIDNLATDFAIINSMFIKTNTEIFTFSGTPEYYVANYLKQRNLKFIYIKENMPVNLPRYVKKFPYAPTGRFFSFPDGKMVTHHIETLENGMAEKKFNFNVVSNTRYFDTADKQSYKFIRLKMRLAFLLSYIFPYKSWIIKNKEGV